MSDKGHNSKMKDPERFLKLCTRYAELEKENKKNNNEKGEIRAIIQDEIGEDKDAFKDVYGYFKKKRHEREGYDESHKRMFDALNEADTGELFDFNIEKAA